MIRLSILFASCLILIGCSGPHYVDYFPYHDDGTMKPRVALVPVFDTTGTEMPWSLSQELTQGMRYKIMDDGNLYLLSREEISPPLAKMGNVNPFGSDFTYANNFQDTDFIVLMELFQHEIVPPGKGNAKAVPGQIHPGCAFLDMKMRIRILDIRCDKPYVVLQEILTVQRPVPNDFSKTFCQVPYGAERYPRTYLASAHQALIDKATSRIDEITWGAK